MKKKTNNERDVDTKCNRYWQTTMSRYIFKKKNKSYAVKVWKRTDNNVGVGKNKNKKNLDAYVYVVLG